MRCSQCGTPLHRNHPGNLCYVCEGKRFDKKIASIEELIDAEDYAYILGLENPESVKRLARNGKLAKRIPGIRKYLWRKEDIDAWFKQKQQEGDTFRRIALGIASNLRTCRYDSVICLSLSDKIGGKVYGQEPVLGTTDAGRVKPIDLVKVDRAVASNALEQLPKKDFPELIDITDWANLIYDRINEDFIVRLEAYFKLASIYSTIFFSKQTFLFNLMVPRLDFKLKIKRTFFIRLISYRTVMD